MPVPPQTKQGGKEQSPEQEINRQPKPIHCKLHDRAVDKAPIRTVPQRPIHLGHPHQRKTPTEAWEAVDDIDIGRTEAWLTAADKPCEQCRHASEECGALHKKQFLSTACRFQYSDAPKLMFMSLHCTRWRLVAK